MEKRRPRHKKGLMQIVTKQRLQHKSPVQKHTWEFSSQSVPSTSNKDWIQLPEWPVKLLIPRHLDSWGGRAQNSTPSASSHLNHTRFSGMIVPKPLVNTWHGIGHTDAHCYLRIPKKFRGPWYCGEEGSSPTSTDSEHNREGNENIWSISYVLSPVLSISHLSSHLFLKNTAMWIFIPLVFWE